MHKYIYGESYLSSIFRIENRKYNHNRNRNRNHRISFGLKYPGSVIIGLVPVTKPTNAKWEEKKVNTG